MTNDLFRDLLDGRIPMAARDPFPFFRARYLLGALPIRPRGGYAIDWITTDDTEPANPHARALWAKQQRGTGPEQETLRNRGRVTRYREKG